MPSCHRPPNRWMMLPLWSSTVPCTSFLFESEPQYRDYSKINPSSVNKLLKKTKKVIEGSWSCFTHLDEGNFAGADVAFEVSDGDLSVMLQIALLAEDVVDAGHYFVPLIVISIPEQNTNISSVVKFGTLKHTVLCENKDRQFTLEESHSPFLLAEFPPTFPKIYFSIVGLFSNRNTCYITICSICMLSQEESHLAKRWSFPTLRDRQRWVDGGRPERNQKETI